MKHPNAVRTASRIGRIAFVAVTIVALLGGGAQAANASQPGAIASTQALAVFTPTSGAVSAKPAVATGLTVKAVWANCSAGRCTVYLSKAETAALGRGAVPAPPAFVTGALRTAYYAFAYGHRWFASQYASWGWCSGFRLSIYPWESQGYFGYRC